MSIEPQCYVFFEDLTTQVQQCYLASNQQAGLQRMARLILEYMQPDDAPNYLKLLQAIQRKDWAGMAYIWERHFEGVDLRILVKPFNAQDTVDSTWLDNTDMQFDLETKIAIATQAAADEKALDPSAEESSPENLPPNPFDPDGEMN